jgi:3-dehydroquinate synthase
MNTVHVNTAKPYDVHIERGLIDRFSELILKAYDKFAVITDDNVAPPFLARVQAELEKCGTVCAFVFPHGEQSKTLETVSKMYAFLSENGLTRTDCIIALGGGVTGDMAGFAAATYLRGIDFLQIPTTLLAQVDSSVGGKTAVDLPSGKNLVGAFCQPEAVFIDPDTLNTLPEVFFADGLGEVLKYGMIRSEHILNLLETHDRDSIKSVLTDIIRECVSIKAEIVSHDEFERGERKLLNFGHTFGHAIERLEHFSGMSHGYAVVAGMKIISEMIKADPSVSDTLDELSGKYGLTRDVHFTKKELLTAASSDKKRTGDSLDLIVCKKPGFAIVKNYRISELSEYCE